MDELSTLVLSFDLILLDSFWRLQRDRRSAIDPSVSTSLFCAPLANNLLSRVASRLSALPTVTNAAPFTLGDSFFQKPVCQVAGVVPEPRSPEPGRTGGEFEFEVNAAKLTQSLDR